MRISLMKVLFYTSCFATALASNTAAAQAKVGYVDIDRVTEKSEMVNSAMKSVQEKVKKFQEDLDSKRKKLVDLRADIKRTEGVVSAEEQNRKKREAQTLENEMDELELQGKREMQRLDDGFFTPTLKRIVYAIQDVAKEKDLDLVVRGEAVLYGRDTADITEAVIKRLNELEKEGTASPSASEKSSSEESEKPAAGTADSQEKSATSSPATSATPAATATPRATPRSARTRPVDRQPD